jgi:hypothetical protein
MYRFTSIARPIDPAYLTNRALLMILPLLMLASGGLASPVPRPPRSVVHWQRLPRGR